MSGNSSLLTGLVLVALSMSSSGCARGISDCFWITGSLRDAGRAYEQPVDAGMVAFPTPLIKAYTDATETRTCIKYRTWFGGKEYARWACLDLKETIRAGKEWATSCGAYPLKKRGEWKVVHGPAAWVGSKPR